jgi:hypothetical protein
MRRTPLIGAIGALALAVTLAVACSEAPTGVPPQPAFAETVAQSVTVPTQPFTGLCPEGYDLIFIPFLPESRQAEAQAVERHGLGRVSVIGDTRDYPGLLDGYVCIKKPPPDDPEKQPIVDNYRPLER